MLPAQPCVGSLPPALQLWDSPGETALRAQTGLCLKFPSRDKSRIVASERISKAGTAGSLSLEIPPYAKVRLNSSCCVPNQHLGFPTAHPPVPKHPSVYAVRHSSANTTSLVLELLPACAAQLPAPLPVCCHGAAEGQGAKGQLTLYPGCCCAGRMETLRT